MYPITSLAYSVSFYTAFTPALLPLLLIPSITASYLALVSFSIENF